MDTGIHRAVGIPILGTVEKVHWHVILSEEKNLARLSGNELEILPVQRCELLRMITRGFSPSDANRFGGNRRERMHDSTVALR
jgi:hypothetical protein